MSGLTKKEKIVMDNVVAPFVFHFLDKFTDEEIAVAVERNLTVADAMRSEEGVRRLYQLKFTLARLPFFNDWVKKLGEEKYVDYFLEVHVKPKRPRLYEMLTSPRGRRWLIGNLKALSEVLQKLDVKM